MPAALIAIESKCLRKLLLSPEWSAPKVAIGATPEVKSDKALADFGASHAPRTALRFALENRFFNNVNGLTVLDLPLERAYPKCGAVPAGCRSTP